MDSLEHFAEFGLTEIRTWAASRKLSCGLERSVRFSPGTLETRRCLLSFSLLAPETSPPAGSIPADVLQICRVMNAPEVLLQSIARFINVAAFVHFGFEYSGTTRIGKCYLELSPPDSSQPRQAGRLQFLGFKWSLQNSSIAVVSRYKSSIVQDWCEIRSLLLAATDHKMRPILDSLLQQLQPSSQKAMEIYPLLEISEEGSDRRSWDLNVYDGQWSLGQIQSSLLAAVEMLQIPQQEFFPWILPITTSALGHIATGIGRNGEPFLTVYYGARGVEVL
jgi:tryptophan halogenase